MRILVITGASRGIGAATAKLFVSMGWTVYNVSRTPNPDPSIHSITCDLEKVGQLAATMQPILDHFSTTGAIISLVHCAAILKKDSIQTLTQSAFQTMLTIGLMAPVALNQVFLPRMKPGSSIIYMGSTLSKIAVKRLASYVCIKHAVLGLMRSTCQDLDNTGIHTCCICPGFTETEMLHEYMGGSEILEKLKNRTAARRLIQPLEIAKLIYFSAENPVINGSVLHANLGELHT